MSLGWLRTSDDLASVGWTCGYCGKVVGGSVGYRRERPEDRKFIYICPHCENPTALIDGAGGLEQYPAPAPSRPIEGLPDDVDALYGEIRRCVQCCAYTSAVLSARKLLMHVAVSQGAEPNRGFADYVRFLAEAHYIPPNGMGWVDAIRRRGNEATHEIRVMSRGDAMRLLDFCEMLLRFVYEFPARAQGGW